ncbi:MAG: hypothetical protein FWD26_09165 [Treponema sp.]|nr:hypothetical protein [Treponema sp.]
MFLRKEEKSADVFWQEYEEKTGEKVLTRALGKYIGGWEEFDNKKYSGIWGLIITTSGGFRFHHFPQNSWIDSLTGFAQKEPPEEKTIFVPQENIVSTDIMEETRWWKKIFSPSVPRFFVNYRDFEQKRMIFEIYTNFTNLKK